MMFWLNSIILFAFTRQTSDPAELRKQAEYERNFYKQYRKGHKR